LLCSVTTVQHLKAKQPLQKGKFATAALFLFVALF